jgi:ABC-type Fe3+ transport system permease subunit
MNDPPLRRLFAWPARLVGLASLVALGVPTAAVGLMAVVDRAPSGTVRTSAFPLALAILDPFAFACLRNSLMITLIVTMLSLFLGVGLGLAGRGRFWGRWILGALGLVPLAAGPLVLASGVRSLVGDGGGWEWLAARSVLGMPCDGLARWLGLVWVELALGVPLVWLATGATLRRFDPTWLEAARAAGATRTRAWFDIAWPLLRPEAARAGAAVFVLTLVEPAGPLILGLDRTLAAQVVFASQRFDDPTRAATLAVIALAVAIVGRTLLVRWGGPRVAWPDPVVPAPRPSLGWRAATPRLLALAGWAAVGVGPVVLVLGRTFAAARREMPGSLDILLRSLFLDRDFLAQLGQGLMIAWFVMIFQVLALALSSGRWSRGLLAGFAAVPPLVVAVGALAVPWLVEAAGDAAGWPTGWGRLIDGLALELAPGRSPGLLLAIAVAAAGLPMLARATVLARSQTNPALVEAALLAGAGRSQAWRAGRGRAIAGVPLLPLILAFTLAATNLTPALLLTPLSETRTLAPGALRVVLASDPLPGRLFAPLATLVLMNTLALAAASRWRAGRLGEWIGR